ncbi:MAG: UDP-N-acetylbacillosamine N-acetyltransferase [Tenericutes bacterium ADurb.BinA124]|nr:MAG: UDP-N-acetylbacillosamine N-acetyltransferase [Tenericutes bacterium ADurb.BinA124]
MSNVDKRAKLLILGDTPYGQVIKEIAAVKYPTIAFLDDESETAIGKLSDLAKFARDYKAVIAFEDFARRKEIYEKLIKAGFSVVSIISPRAFVAKSAQIEPGCVIEPMAVVHTGAKINKGTFVCAGAVVNHHAVVNEFCKIDCNAVVNFGV